MDFPGKNPGWVASSLSRDLPHPGIEPESASLLHWQADSLPLSHHGNPMSRRSLWQKLCAGFNELPFHHNHIYTYLPLTSLEHLSPPYFFGAISLSYLKWHFPGYSLHFAPGKTELGTSHIVHFLKVSTLESFYIPRPSDDPPNLTWNLPSLPHPGCLNFAFHLNLEILNPEWIEAQR